MKSIKDFLYNLKNLDIEVFLDGFTLRCNAPKGILTPEIKTELAEHKAEIIAYFQKQLSEQKIIPAHRDTHLPLSYAQGRLWFLEELEAGKSTKYNVPSHLQIDGFLNIVVLEKTLQEIIRRHEILRTNFSQVNGTPIQIINPDFTLALPIIDLQELPDVQQSAEVKRLINEDNHKPFNLASDPLIRTNLLKLAPQSYILLLTFHHIVLDAWSVGIFIQELSSLYQSYLHNLPSSLPDLPIQYADFAVWQQQYLSGEVLENQLNYWKKKLANLPSFLELPTDKPHHLVKSSTGQKQTFAINLELTQKLKDLSRQSGTTMFMTLLAGFAILLSRYSAQEDIAIGSPIANRNQRQTESLLGFFVNTLVLRINLENNPTFTEILSRVRQVTLEANEYQDLPFEKLVEALQPVRDISHSPLFRVMFSAQKEPLGQLELPGITLTPIPTSQVTETFDLSLLISENSTGLQGYWEYNSDLFTEETIARLAINFQTLLADIVAHPQKLVSELSLLTEPEKHQLLVEWNTSKTEVLTNQCIHELIAQQAEKTPNAIAVEIENQQLTYQQLNTRANQLANYLQSIGVKPEQLIGICVERSLDMIVGLLGILKVGGAYIPLDPQLPTERFTYILEDTQISILLTQEKLRSRLPEHQLLTICLDTDWELINQHNLEYQNSGVQPHNLAYIIYTSGSTGKPKGVMIEHRTLTNFALVAVKEYSITAVDRVLQFASISFDIAVEEIYPCLSVGGTVVLRTTEMLRSSDDFWQYCRDWQLTVLDFSTAYWHQLTAELITKDQRIPECLRLVIIGGEAAKLELVQRWQQSILHLVHPPQLVNGYGPTETTVTTSLYFIDGQEEISIPIGKPIGNIQMYVLDKYLQPVPIGVSGELHIGGASLARGYLHRPELTAEKFILSPFNEVVNNSYSPSSPSSPSSLFSDNRLYKTGDLVRYRADGNLEFLGRVDNQVKIRGFRIELGEIEAVLMQHQKVQATVVTLREDRLVAYVVANSSLLTSHELRQFLKPQLPEYMLPGAWVMLDVLPMTSNGKIDYRALPAPELELSITHSLARTPTQELIADIIALVLRRETVGIDDNFFELGGHSLLATQVISRLRETFEVDLPLRCLFESPTVVELEEAILKRQQQSAIQQVPAIVPQPRNTAQIPLSFAQSRLWFLNQLEGIGGTYNIAAASQITGNLNIAILEKSIQTIIERHEILRTNFQDINGLPIQIIHPETNLNLSAVDVQDDSVAKEQLLHLVSLEALQPFNLTEDALVRVKLWQLDSQEYVLLLAMHHIVSDGWSMGIFSQELSILYEAFSSGNASPFPQQSIQYADYALWQRQWLSGEVLEAQLSYWQQQLADAPPLLELPTDKPRPVVQTFRGNGFVFSLDAELSRQLKILSQQSGTTLFMTLLTAFSCLLSRYTGQDNILIGSPVANRNRQETESVIGFFVNTLVLRSQISDNTKFSELLAQIRQVALEAYTHQDVPFEQIVERLQLERHLSYSPLFQVIFDLENSSTEQLELPGLTLTPLEIGNITAKFDLSLFMRETPTGLQGSWEYNSDLFFEETITRLARNFQTLLADIVAHPQKLVGELSLLSEAEKHQILSVWNEPNIDDSVTTKLVHELFAEQVAKTPKAIAVVCGDRELTYEELEQKANQLAHYLQSVGVGTETLVGLCVERTSCDLIIALLAIIKAGGAYLPLDPTYPPERLAFMLEDGGVFLAIAQNHLLSLLPSQTVRVICIDTDWPIIAQNNQEQPITTVTTDNLIYVTYTSGSTGKPKGVAIPHRGVTRLVQNTNYIHITANDVVAQISNYGFDAAKFEIFGALLNGAKLVIIHKDIVLSPTDFSLVITKEKISVLFLTTALFNQIARNTPNAFQLVKYLLFGGESVEPKWVREVLKNGAPQQLIHVYGPTENTTFSCWYLITNVPIDATTVPIGKSITNTQTYVLDTHLQPVPIGVAGELYVGGAGLARGYLNHPELTDAKFIPHPFENSSSSRLYKTGDLVRYLPDGNLEFLGRIDNQVKIRGFRIELGEIEAVLLQHSQVKTAVVRVWEDQPGDKRLVAYILSDTQPPTSHELRQFLQERLPDYMLPTAWVVLDSLPLTVNGKVDFRALPAPTIEFSDDPLWVKPSTLTQELIADIIAQVLRLERVGINDNFFELGGHSLLATQVISRLRDTFNIDLPLRCLFEFPTVKELDLQIASYRQTKSNLRPRPIESLPRDINTFPPSFAQLRLWFLEQLEEKSTVYNMPFAFYLCGHLNTTALEQAIQAIVQRHEALRTNFQTIDDTPVQIIHPTVNISLPIIDIRNFIDPQAEAQRLATLEADITFDLAKDILIRTQLLWLAEEEYVLLLTLHHIISDGWSMGIFDREISTLYRAFATNQPSPLSPLLIQYADYAVWQRQWLQGDVLEAQLNYWLQQLSDTTPLLELPTSKPRPAVQTFQGSSCLFWLNAELTQQISQLSRRVGATLFMTLLAAFTTLLYRYSGQEDILIGSPIANRNHHATESLIGFFVNTLVLRSQIKNNPTFLELLQQVRQTALDAYMHQDVPFEQVVEALQPERSLSYNPLFQVMFVLQNTSTGNLDLGDVTWNVLTSKTTTTTFDLTLTLVETEGELHGEWEYNKDLFEEEAIANLSKHFQSLLTSIVTDPDQKIAYLPLFTQPEQQQLLREWNQKTIPYPHNQCIHELIATQAKQTPNKVAIIHQNQQLTYQELDQRANQLAHYLQRLGVQPETLVGISLERSLETIVGLLAILKAGGAYVPIDPAYPRQRLEYILEDAQLTILITQEKLLSKLSNYQGKTICLDTDWTEISQQSQSNPVSAVTINNLAYIIYTSGSTGKPKGVMIEQRSLTNFTQVVLQEYGISQEDRILQFSSISFDAAIEEIFPCLSIGGTLVLRTEEMLLSSDDFWEYCQDLQLTIIVLSTAYWQQLVSELNPQDPRIPKNLKRMIFGGEQVQREAINQWHKAVAHFPHPPLLINGYGPTETTVATILYTCYQPEPTSVPIGKSMGNTQVYVLDKYLQPVPIGVPGELHIGGVCLARGYLHRPDLTIEKFIPNPFDNYQSTRLYKTGDLVRYRPDGNLEFLGRVDNQVKIRGFRIELGEIETLLMQHPQVQATVVTVWEEQPVIKNLVAYIVTKSIKLSSQELRQFLQQKLPDYLLPSAWVILDSLPLTSNNKIDYRALPKPELEFKLDRKIVSPRNAVEFKLAKIWSEVLNVYPVGVTDNFFELGGHSLLAVTLMSKIKQQFAQKLPLASIFQTGTIEQQATLLHQPINFRPWSPLTPLQIKGNKPPLFIVHPGGGSVLNYVHLADTLSPHQPVYGLETLGFDEGQEPQSRLEEMAHDYIKALQTIQPQGPYFLAGWCFGGLVAFEISQQLQAQGQKIAFLAFLDIYDFFGDISTQLLDDTELFLSFFGGHLQVSSELLQQLAPDEKLSYLIAEAKKFKFVPLDFDLVQLHRILKVGKCHDIAAINYIPQHYNGKITMFQALEGFAAKTNNPTQGWEKLADVVDLHWVPGDHRTMLTDPHVPILAEKLRICIDKIQLHPE